MENKTRMLTTQQKFDIAIDDPEVKATTHVVTVTDLSKSWNEKCIVFSSLSSAAVRVISTVQKVARAKFM